MERLVTTSTPAAGAGTEGAALVVVGGEHDPARLAIPYLLEHEGLVTRLARSGEEAAGLLDALPVSFALDLRGPGATDVTTLAEAARRRGIPVLVAAESVDAAADSGVIAVPRDVLLHQLGAVVRQVRAASRAWSELRRLAMPPSTPEQPTIPELGFTGAGPRRRELLGVIPSIAAGMRPVIVSGPRGAGKRFLAHVLHGASSRRSGPLVVVEGSDPAARAPDRLAAAHGGTLVVTQLDALAPAEQHQLLRLAEERRLTTPAGAVQVDARLVLTVSDDALAKVAVELREGCAALRVPALRETPEDLPPLAHGFLVAEAERIGRPVRGLSIGAIEALVAHEWPGNLRELKAACEHAAAVAPEPFVRAEDFPESLLAAIAGTSRPAHPGLGTVVAAVEKSVLRSALIACGGRLEATGAFLRVPLRTLRRKCARHGLRSRDFHARKSSS